MKMDLLSILSFFFSVKGLDGRIGERGDEGKPGAPVSTNYYKLTLKE